MTVASTAVAPNRSVAIKDWLQKLGPQFLPPLLLLVVVVFGWQVLCSGDKPRLPPPTAILKDSWKLIADPFLDRGGVNKGLALQIWESLRRVAVGYTLAALVGIGGGIAIGTNKLLFRACDPFFQILRTIPPLAWLPIALATFRQVEPSAIFVIFITAVWPVLINTAVGVQEVPQDYRNVARVLQLPRLQYFWTILLPSAAPYIFTGMRIAVGLSWLAIVAAEMLTGGVGIGFFIWDSYNSSRMSDLIVALVYVGVVGFVLDKAIYYLGKVVVQSDGT
jgi:nitrate/nitrite transport system permease protein